MLSEGGVLKIIDACSWDTVSTLPRLPHRGTDFTLSFDGNDALVALGNGQLFKQAIPDLKDAGQGQAVTLKSRYLDAMTPVGVSEAELRKSRGEQDEDVLEVQGGSDVVGAIGKQGEVDYYRWNAKKGELGSIDADAGEGSNMDPFVAMLDAEKQPVLRTR